MTTRRRFLTWLGLAPVAAVAPQKAEVSAIDWAAGQAPSAVNESARQMMAAVASFRDEVIKWGYPNHPGVAGPCEFEDGSKWNGFEWTRGPRKVV